MKKFYIIVMLVVLFIVSGTLFHVLRAGHFATVNANGFLQAVNASAEIAPAEPFIWGVATEKEVGTLKEYHQETETFTSNCNYPVLDVEEADRQVELWVDKINDQAKKVIEDDVFINGRGEGQLLLDYNAYGTYGKYAGIQFVGASVFTLNEHDVSYILETFNFNLKTGELIDSAGLFPLEKRDELATLIIQKLEEKYPESADKQEEIKSRWMLHPIIKEKGILFSFDDGVVRAPGEGIAEVGIAYWELGAMVTLPPTVAIDPEQKMIALTFDDGPSNLTLDVLDILDAHNAQATFFVLGNRIEKQQDILQQIIAKDCEIASHSWDHTQLTKLGTDGMNAQITDTNNAIISATGVMPTLLRPPYGSFNDSLKAECMKENMAILMWDVDTLDWKHRDAQSIYDMTMDQAHDGAIILYHDLYDTTIEAIEMVVPALIQEGYQLVTVSDMLNYDKDHFAVPGNVYFNLERAVAIKEEDAQ